VCIGAAISHRRCECSVKGTALSRPVRAATIQGLQSLCEYYLIFGVIYTRREYVSLSSVFSGAGLSCSASRGRSSERGSSVFFRSQECREAGSEPVRSVVRADGRSSL